MQKVLFSIAALFLTFIALTPLGARPTESPKTFASVTGKKLIEYGWNQFYAPDINFIRDHIREMEQQPFEGIAFRLPSQQSNVFKVKNWKEDSAARNEQIKVLSSIQWQKFTDNFLTIYAASDMDWYSDADWQKVLSKARFTSQAAHAAKCVGIVFDPEAYGKSPWKYVDQAHADEHSFADYSAKAFSRGQEFIQALQGDMPDLKLLMFHQYSGVLWEAYSLNPATRAKQLQGSNYGLMIPFLNGMLSKAGRNVQLIDGNEDAYYYKSPESFYRAYWQMRQNASINVPDDLKKKFNDQIRAGSSLYVDQIYAYRSATDKWRPPVLAHAMTPEERNKWFEQNVYYALQTSDEYVWLYGERIDWFGHSVLPTDSARNKEWKNVAPPDGIKNAINSAKQKLMNGQSLDDDMAPIFAAAQAKVDAAKGK
jgi:hypothetical protein